MSTSPVFNPGLRRDQAFVVILEISGDFSCRYFYHKYRVKSPAQQDGPAADLIELPAANCGNELDPGFKAEYRTGSMCGRVFGGMTGITAGLTKEVSFLL